MKRLLLVIAIGCLFGCGDPNYQEHVQKLQPVQGSYSSLSQIPYK